MGTDGLDIQGGWDADTVRSAGWPAASDSQFITRRLFEMPAAVTGRGATGRVLEVAAAEAVHSCKLSIQGLDVVVLEPSPAMLAAARVRMAEYGTRLTLVRGIAETLPFRDASFDRVLCDSSIDHFAAPDAGVGEMARVCKPDGRLVIGVVNYGSLSVRLSRLAYRVGRGLGRLPRHTRQFWDTPVPFDHTFECTHGELLRLCGRYCELEEVLGVSMGWAVPGWGALLGRLPAERATVILRGLDALARRVPRWADYLLTVWRPRPRAAARGTGQETSLRVARHDPAYRWKIDYETRVWSRPPAPPPAGVPAVIRFSNARLTGDASRSWLDDLVARGPFRTAAALGCDDENHAEAWVHAAASDSLDVFELSPGAIRRNRRGLPRRVRFVRVDLNFVQLPRERYDVVWSSGTLHHLVNLEHLLDQVALTLRPGGLFALHDYVGETRFAYHPRRLERVNAALHDVPSRFRRNAVEVITPPPLTYHRGAFCAVRSADVLPLARARFDVVHEGYAEALYPLFHSVDLAAIAAEAPAVLERLLAAEDEALHDPTIRPCVAYVVLRRR